MELDSYCNGNKFDLRNFLADVMRTKLLSEGYLFILRNRIINALFAFGAAPWI